MGGHTHYWNLDSHDLLDRLPPWNYFVGIVANEASAATSRWCVLLSVWFGQPEATLFFYYIHVDCRLQMKTFYIVDSRRTQMKLRIELT